MSFSRRKLLQSCAAGSLQALAWRVAGSPQNTPDRHLGPFPPLEENHKAIVIGTGYGGAVSALRLGQAGVNTLMLEMGNNWNTPGLDHRIFCKMSKPDHRAMWFRTRTEVPVQKLFGFNINQNVASYPGVLDRVNFQNMAVYLGRGVGGGSLVNGGMAVTPKREVFESRFPNIDSDEMYEKFFPRSRALLGVSKIPSNLLNHSKFYRYSQVARRSASRAGFKTTVVPNIYDYEYMQKEERNEVPRSAFDKEVIYGNNAGKKSLDKTYLAEAMSTGNVALKYLHRVDRIKQVIRGGEEKYEISVSQINLDGQVSAIKTFQCDYLFLCAGSLGTTQLLLRAFHSGDLPDLSFEIGRGWGNNGNIMTARANKPWHPTGARQSSIPALAIDDWDNSGTFAEVAPIPTGFETWINLYLAITDNPERGEFKYNPNTNTSQLLWSRDNNQLSEEIARSLFDRMNRKNRTLYRIDLFGGRRKFAGDFTYHPLGGCLLEKATDSFGRVRGYKNLFVNDGALVPGNIGVNPFLTITALAERNMETLLRAMNLAS